MKNPYDMSHDELVIVAMQVYTRQWWPTYLPFLIVWLCGLGTGVIFMTGFK